MRSGKVHHENCVLLYKDKVQIQFALHSDPASSRIFDKSKLIVIVEQASS